MTPPSVPVEFVSANPGLRHMVVRQHGSVKFVIGTPEVLCQWAECAGRVWRDDDHRDAPGGDADECDSQRDRAGVLQDGRGANGEAGARRDQGGRVNRAYIAGQKQGEADA